MDFFEPEVEESRWNKNFSSVLAPFRKHERDLFNKWAEGFVDRDGKIIKEFQTTFNSTFWEIYLYACFKDYNFEIDFSKQSPDFSLKSKGSEFIIEAATANAADGKPNEWDKTFSDEEMKALKPLKKLNTEAIIRLSNSILGKHRKYKSSYENLPHVKNKPFILALAPFEQPHFNLQFDRPIRALLYDYYVDEDSFLINPERYPNGPLGINLGYVEKENGTEIPLGLFNDDGVNEISAVIFSCTATWGKLSAMSKSPDTHALVQSIWSTPPNGAPVRRVLPAENYDETILDGLQVYHNPYAKYPLPPSVFHAPRVVQHYFSSGTWIYEANHDALLYRQVIATSK